MKEFRIIDGQVLDLQYKKVLVDGLTDSWLFYIGDVYYGRVFKNSWGWTAVSNVPHTLCPVYGFRSRRAAAKYIMKTHGLGD